MATKEEILSTFDSKEGAWWAYKEGIRIGYNEALKWVYEHTYGDNYKLSVKDKMQEFIKE